MKRMVLSIIIVNWNTRELLRRCLESVQAETTVRHEVFVVDNASCDGSPEMVASDFPEVHLLSNDENRGFAAANNQALAKAAGHYCLLLNSDTVVLDHALDRLVGYLDRHLEAGAVACKLLNADGTLQPSAHNFYSTFGSLVENRLVERFWKKRSARTSFLSFWDHSRTRRVDWVTGACLMVRRQVIDAVGLLDEGFFMYGEEVDWQYRMRQAGFEVHFFHEPAIIHLGGASAAQAPEATRKLEAQSRIRLIEKHYHPLSREIFRFKSALAAFMWRVAASIGSRRKVSVSPSRK